MVRLKGTPNTDASWPDNVRIFHLQAMYDGSVNIYAKLQALVYDILPSTTAVFS